MSGSHEQTYWRNRLRYDGKRIRPDHANIVIILRDHEDLAGRIRYDAFANRIAVYDALPWNSSKAVRPWTDADTNAFLVWLQELDIAIKHAGVVNTAVEHAARQIAIHPVQDYLYRQKWDGTPRLATALTRIFSASGDEQYLREIFLRFMVSAVARVKEPGCKVDHMLVLEGPQGCGKSRAVLTLAPYAEWYTDGIPNLGSKDAMSHVQGVWILELPELAAMMGQATEQTKAFLSRGTDRFRPCFGRHTVTVPRQCVFVGTTNSSTYLSDSTGNRRFWPVCVGKIDIVALRTERAQLWAEAAHLYDSGEHWHLSGGLAEIAVIEAEQRRNVSEVECLVTNYLMQRLAEKCTSVSTEEIYCDVLKLQRSSESYGRLATQYSREVVNTLTRLGWTKGKVTGRGVTRKNNYYPPS